MLIGCLRSVFRCEANAATTLNEYKKAFDDVRKITGATEPDELIEQFVKMEDKNFALFNCKRLFQKTFFLRCQLYFRCERGE